MAIKKRYLILAGVLIAGGGFFLRKKSSGPKQAVHHEPASVKPAEDSRDQNTGQSAKATNPTASDKQVAQAPHQMKGKKSGGRKAASVGSAKVIDPALLAEQNRFFSQSEKAWSAIKDSGKIKYLSSGAFRVGSDQSAVKEFLRGYAAALFNVSENDLKEGKIFREKNETYTYEQYYQGKRIFGASLAIVKDGENIVEIKNDLTPQSLYITDRDENVSAQTACNTHHWDCAKNPEQVWYPTTQSLTPAYVIKMNTTDTPIGEVV